MPTITVFLLSALMIHSINFDGCKGKGNKNDAIRAAYFHYYIPVVYYDGYKKDFNAYYRVYHSGNVDLYQFNYQYDSLMNDEPQLSEVRYRYFVHHRDSAYGYLYDPFESTEKREAVDSLKKFRFENPSWDSIANKKPDSTFRNDTGDSVYVYHLPPVKQYPGSFTYYFYYTAQIKGIRESFSKKLEAIHRKKLYRIRMVVHAAYDETRKMALPEMESYYEMKEIEIDNIKEVEGYFMKYKMLTGKR